MPELFKNQQQTANSIILRSTVPNFERDQFAILQDMYEVSSGWMDEGHISYCLEAKKHYIYRTIDEDGKKLSGANRWISLEDEVKSIKDSKDNSIPTFSVDSYNEELFNKLPESLIYVKDDNILYYKQNDNIKPINDLSNYITKDQIGEWENSQSLIDYINSKYTTKEDFKEISDEVSPLSEKISSCVTKDQIGDFGDSTTLVDYINNEIKSEIEFSRADFDQLVTKDDLEEYVSENAPNIEKLVTKEELDEKGFITIDDVPVLENIATKDDLGKIEDQITTITTATGAIQQNLDNHIADADKKYLSKDDAETIYVKGSTYQNESGITSKRLQDLENEVVNLHKEDDNIKNTYTTKEEFDEHITDFESFKEFVDDTYVKPDEVSEKLNTYSPTVENRDKWIGSDFAGALAGKTGSEVAAANYSYNAVLDEMLFFDFTPTVSEPSVEVGLVEDWQGPGSVINWYDKENRIITVKCGSTGPDGGDFYATKVEDALISYPKGLDLSNKFTNGLIKQTDEKQSSVGFCKVKDENGEWVYYKKEGNIYHVPATFEQEGEYRYYLVAYFEKGSPAKNNKNELISEWNINTPIESKDYITIIATKSIYYLAEDGKWVENGTPIWSSEQVTDYLTLKPSCQLQQAFKLPRKIKGLYIWNDVAGDYAMVPFVNQKDEDGQWVDNLIPAYFEESVDENGYYTYIYDSNKNGHRGEIKIKVVF